MTQQFLHVPQVQCDWFESVLAGQGKFWANCTSSSTWIGFCLMSRGTGPHILMSKSEPDAKSVYADITLKDGAFGIYDGVVVRELEKVRLFSADLICWF
jgi:hypothetical protein